MDEKEIEDLGEKAGMAIVTFFGFVFGFLIAMPVMVAISGLVGAMILYFTWPIINQIFPILPKMTFFELWCFAMTLRIIFGGAHVKSSGS